MDQDLYTTGQVGKKIGYSAQSVRNKIKEGKLDCLWIDGQIRITEQSVDGFLNKYGRKENNGR